MQNDIRPTRTIVTVSPCLPYGRGPRLQKRLFHREARASWPILASVIALAVGVWGLYAWKYAAPANRPVTVSFDSKHEPQAPLTTLRATRPIENPSVQEELSTNAISSSVNVNSPSTLEGDGVEITLKGNPAAPAPIARPSVAQPLVYEPSPRPTTAGLRHDESKATLPSPYTGEGDRIQDARLFLAKGDLVGARNAFSTALQGALPPAQESEARRELERIASALLFSRAANTTDPLASVHTIAPGDSIHAIARQHRVTEELVMRINNISEPNRLAVGQRLKVIEGPFRAVISKSHHRMDIYLGEIFVRSFRVGLGTNGGTPTGSWVVRNKLPNPDWTDPRNGRHYLADDPDNPIGERWIGLEGVAGEAVGKQGFGIHGTIDPASIGENLSMGCVRLSPDDVKFVYDLLVERDTQVEIRS
jgi:lipoprotein-anchoring transpeptidase ErfK/SrfK